VLVSPLQLVRRWRWRLLASALLVLVALLSVAPYMGSSTELVRMRHALLYVGAHDGADGAFSWTPQNIPADFLQESGPIDPLFSDVVQRLRLEALPDDWARALAISEHLLTSQSVLNGGAIQGDLHATYQGIVGQGAGYCGDFVRAFTALALAAGIPVRNWAFSFDGFGGHGHVWPEIWNREKQAWQLLDVFDNYYFTLADGQPLSALAFRSALLEAAPDLRLHALTPKARPGYADESKAWAYFRRGLPQWYMWWGNNVYAYDNEPLVRMLAGRSRSLEQLSGVMTGSYPGLMVLAAPSNQVQREALVRVHWHLMAVAAVVVAGLLAMVWAVWGWVGARRKMLVTAPGVLAQPGISRAAVDPLRLRLAVVGPLPPPSGGMANQCAQLVRLLRAEGMAVELVRTNAPYVPAWSGRIPVLRALVRLVPYLLHLWRACGRADVVHVLANSGWAWHLFAAPAIAIAHRRGTPVIVNYRGGNADTFFAAAPRHVLRMLGQVALRVTPSTFLVRVFRAHGLDAEVVPNIVDLSRFKPAPERAVGDAPHLIVTRNLEPIYDIPTAIRVLVELRRSFAHARLTVAGSGPELERLRTMARELGVQDAVHFTGRIDNADIPALYASADCVINPSTVDNMPNSILEAFASGVPVVSTDAGGIPDMVVNGESGLLVPVRDVAAMAQGVASVLRDPALAQRLRQAGLAEAARYDWPKVRDQWLDAYRRAALCASPRKETA
jgi:glycosyltransferase involved in cell wall biosynthesis